MVTPTTGSSEMCGCLTPRCNVKESQAKTRNLFSTDVKGLTEKSGGQCAKNGKGKHQVNWYSCTSDRRDSFWVQLVLSRAHPFLSASIAAVKRVWIKVELNIEGAVFPESESSGTRQAQIIYAALSPQLSSSIQILSVAGLLTSASSVFQEFILPEEQVMFSCKYLTNS